MNQPKDPTEKLKNLLACKRYEQPPPGYFSRFPERLRARLEAEEFVEYSSLWQWLVNKFDAKPVVACVYGVALSTLLLAGFNLSQVFDTEAAVSPVAGGPWMGWTPPTGLMDNVELARNRYRNPSSSVLPVAFLPVNSVSSSRFVLGTPIQRQPALFAPFQD